MMVTDGQLLSEGWAGTSMYIVTTGLGLWLGSGAVPTMANVTANGGLYVSGGARLLTLSNITSYIKTTLGRTLFVDAFFSNVSHFPVPGGKIVMNFSLASHTPSIAVAGTPTWGMLFYPTDNRPSDGQTFSTSSVVHVGKVFIFSVGANGSGADVIMPADGNLTVGQLFRMSNITIPISNIVA